MAATDPLRLHYSASVRVIGFGEELRALLDRIDPAGVEGVDWVIVDDETEGDAGEGADILVLTAGDCSGEARAAPGIGSRASRRGALVAGVVVSDDVAGMSATACLEDLRDAVDVLIVGDESAFAGYLYALRDRP